MAIAAQQAKVAQVISELAGTAEFWELHEVLSEDLTEPVWEIVEAFNDARESIQEETEKAATVLDEVEVQLLRQPKTREEMGIWQVGYSTELYRLRPHLVARALRNTKVVPEIDAFSVESSKQCSRWWGPDSSEAKDAFAECWGNNILWMNPPYTQLQRTVRKLREDQAHALVAMPEWSTRGWWAELQAMVLWRWRLPAGSKVFEMFGRACGATRWPVQVLVICGAEHRCKLLQLQAGVVHGPRREPSEVACIKTSSTTSMKRRLRRQRLREWRATAAAGEVKAGDECGGSRTLPPSGAAEGDETSSEGGVARA